MSTPDQVQKFLEFTASVKNGARRDTCLSWLKARGLSRVKSEELIETLLETGAIVPQDFVVAGETITRYLTPSGSVEPAPLPTSDAPPEPIYVEPVVTRKASRADAPPEEPAATIAEVREELRQEGVTLDAADFLEEPVAVAGAAEPCEECEYLRLQLNAPCQECDRLRQERDMAQGEAYGLRQQLQEVSAERDEARARCAAWEQEADHAYRQLCRAADLEEGSPLSSILERVRLLVGAAKASAERPVVDHGAVAHYLLDLPEERWEALAQARRDLAQGRRLAEHGARLQAEALAAVDRLLDTSAGTPAPELVPDPIPLGDTPPAPPPSGEQPTGGTMVDRTLEFFRAHPDEEIRAQQIADALGGDRQRWTVPLSTLAAGGQIERLGWGLYRLARKGRRVA